MATIDANDLALNARSVLLESGLLKNTVAKINSIATPAVLGELNAVIPAASNAIKCWKSTALLVLPTRFLCC